MTFLNFGKVHFTYKPNNNNPLVMSHMCSGIFYFKKFNSSKNAASKSFKEFLIFTELIQF